MATSQKRSCLYDLGWIRQKGEWLGALKSKSGRYWIDLGAMDGHLREQIASGEAYVDKNGESVSKDQASFILLKSGVFTDPGLGQGCCEVLMKFSRNAYGMWEGIDFELAEPTTGSDSEEQGTREDPLFDWIWFDDFEAFKEMLAGKAVDEWWGGQPVVCKGEDGAQKRRNPLLEPYLRYTFSRLLQDDAVAYSRDQELMAFNTGLVERHSLDPIVVCCRKNEKPHPEWRFDRFVVWRDRAGKEGDDRIERILKGRFDAMPQPVAWFARMDQTFLPAQAIDLSDENLADLRSRLERTIPDCLLDRLVADSGLMAEADVKQLSSEPDPDKRKFLLNGIIREMGGKEMVTDLAFEHVRDALELAKKRLRWEVGAAVPMWAASKDGLAFSFMLPLSFNRDEPLRADLAVVLDPVQQGSGDRLGLAGYRPRGFLELRNAYSNARLLRRPEASWLREFAERARSAGTDRV